MDKKLTLTARLYRTDFQIQEISPANGLYFTLEELQGYVGGIIQIIPLDGEGHEDRLLILHEEGKLISLSLNVPATLIWIMYYGETDFVCGDAIVCHPSFIR
jgi:hypothetical protein